jgi:hypothetical protein
LERVELFAETTIPPDLVVSIHTNSMPMHHDFTSQEGVLMFYTLDHSEQAANDILAHIANNTGHDFVPAIRRNFAMARYIAAPSMLFEMGFMCNPLDYERLLDSDYLDLIAESLGEAIVQHLLDVIGEPEESPPETVEIVTSSPESVTTTPITTQTSETPETRQFDAGSVMGITSFLFVAIFFIYEFNKVRRKRK